MFKPACSHLQAVQFLKESGLILYQNTFLFVETEISAAAENILPYKLSSLKRTAWHLQLFNDIKSYLKLCRQ